LREPQTKISTGYGRLFSLSRGQGQRWRRLLTCQEPLTVAGAITVTAASAGKKREIMSEQVLTSVRAGLRSAEDLSADVRVVTAAVLRGPERLSRNGRDRIDKPRPLLPVHSAAL